MAYPQRGSERTTSSQPLLLYVELWYKTYALLGALRLLGEKKRISLAAVERCVSLLRVFVAGR
jgi:hypothetical protein